MALLIVSNQKELARDAKYDIRYKNSHNKADIKQKAARAQIHKIGTELTVPFYGTSRTNWVVSKRPSFSTVLTKEYTGSAAIFFAMNPDGMGSNYREGIEDDMTDFYENTLIYNVMSQLEKKRIFTKTEFMSSISYVPQFMELEDKRTRFDAVWLDSNNDIEVLEELYFTAISAAYQNKVSHLIFTMSCFRYNDYMLVTDTICDIIENHFKNCFTDVTLVSPYQCDISHNITQLVLSTVDYLRGQKYIGKTS
jgi:hypothetical protein